jgi:hypothetical protein
MYLAGADTLASAESGLLAGPADVAVAPDGEVYVADQTLGRVVRFGARPAVLGRGGTGPGEFRAPIGVAVDGDTVRVDDRGNGRVQVLATSGRYVRSFPLPLSSPGEAAIASDGGMAVATMGISFPALAVLLDRDGRQRGQFGAPLANPTHGWNLQEMKTEARNGRVPPALLNTAVPAVSREGTWLVFLAQGSVRRYDAHGALLWSTPLDSPEIEAIRHAYVVKNREDNRSFAFSPLAYAADITVVGERLWVLLNTTEDESSVVLVIGPRGAVEKRLVLSAIRGARDLAVDTTRRKMYLAVPSSASVVSVVLPAGV